MDYFRNVVALPSLAATGAKLSFKGFVTGELWIALVTFLYIDFLDTTGTLFSMASFINNYIPGARRWAFVLCVLSRTTWLQVQASQNHRSTSLRLTLLAHGRLCGREQGVPAADVCILGGRHRQHHRQPHGHLPSACAQSWPACHALG